MRWFVVHTNYFIFPGDTGADASWLKGAAFEGEVTVSFSDGAKTWKSAVIHLVPHTHAGGGHGDHDDHAGHDHK